MLVTIMTYNLYSVCHPKHQLIALFILWSGV